MFSFKLIILSIPNFSNNSFDVLSSWFNIYPYFFAIFPIFKFIELIFIFSPDLKVKLNNFLFSNDVLFIFKEPFLTNVNANFIFSIQLFLIF